MYILYSIEVILPIGTNYLQIGFYVLLCHQSSYYVVDYNSGRCITFCFEYFDESLPVISGIKKKYN